MEPKKIVNKPLKELGVRPLTRQELHDAAHERVSLITHEFTEAFSFLQKYPKSITCFGGARFQPDSAEYSKARSIGHRVATELGYSVVTGGGPGIMEGANRGAFEAGGQSIGFTIELPNEQVRNPYLSKHLDLYYFFSRKVALSFSAEAYLFFPGGYGTLDEFFEIVTLVQTRKIERVPLILVGTDFWGALDSFIKKELLTRKTIDPEDVNLYTITDDEDQILEIIRNAPIRNGIKFTHPLPGTELSHKKCVPCEEGTDPLDPKTSAELIKEVDNWNLVENERLEKTYSFNDFVGALHFVTAVGAIAEREGHHPDICIIRYKHVRVSLTTHAIKGLSENDFIIAAKIDEMHRG